MYKRGRFGKDYANAPALAVQIAATAIDHDFELITGNLRHFSRISDSKRNNILANSRNQ